MKKIFLFVAGFFLVATVSQAQIKFGAKGGVNISNIDIEVEGISISPDALTSFHVGVMAKYQFSEQFGIQPELVYSAEGAEIESDKFNLNFINIPILFAYNPTEIFSIHAGPQVGILSSAEVDGEDIKDELKGLNLSLAIGAAVELTNGFTGGVRYNLGLSDLNDAEGDESTLKANTFQIYVGYFFIR